MFAYKKACSYKVLLRLRLLHPHEPLECSQEGIHARTHARTHTLTHKLNHRLRHGTSTRPSLVSPRQTPSSPPLPSPPLPISPISLTLDLVGPSLGGFRDPGGVSGAGLACWDTDAGCWPGVSKGCCCLAAAVSHQSPRPLPPGPAPFIHPSHPSIHASTLHHHHHNPCHPRPPPSHAHAHSHSHSQRWHPSTHQSTGPGRFQPQSHLVQASNKATRTRLPSPIPIPIADCLPAWPAWTPGY